MEVLSDAEWDDFDRFVETLGPLYVAEEEIVFRDVGGIDDVLCRAVISSVNKVYVLRADAQTQRLVHVVPAPTVRYMRGALRVGPIELARLDESVAVCADEP